MTLTLSIFLWLLAVWMPVSVLAFVLLHIYEDRRPEQEQITERQKKKVHRLINRMSLVAGAAAFVLFLIIRASLGSPH